MAAACSDAGASAGSRKRPFTCRQAEEEPDPKFESSLAKPFLSLYNVVVRTGRHWCTTHRPSRPESAVVQDWSREAAEQVVQLELEFAHTLQKDAVRALGTAISAKIDMYREYRRTASNSAVSEEVLAMVDKSMECLEDFTTMLLDLEKIKDLLLPRHHQDLLSLLNEINTPPS